MAPTSQPPVSALKKRSFEEMSQEELIEQLQARDKMIQKLQAECKKLKKEKPAAAATISPEKAREKAQKLKTIAYRNIKSQMKWKPKCKYGTARWSFAGLCDEPTFRALMNLTDKDKTKGKKMTIEAFQAMMGCGSITSSIRYGYLELKNDTVNVSYSQKDGQIKITGAYGMA